MSGKHTVLKQKLEEVKKERRQRAKMQAEGKFVLHATIKRYKV